jgi:CubicO group peptidase (beta-lactamase class C family)
MVVLVVGLAAGAHAQVPDDEALPGAPSVLGAPADGPRLAVGEPIPPAELEAFVDATVRLGMDQAHVAGAAVAIVQQGQPVLLKGYGFASFDPVRRIDPNATLFRIGSITKTFTWIAAMRAVESGKLDLDAPINRYLPPQLAVPDGDFPEPITMRHLMTHTPGFEDHAVGILFANDPARIRTLDEILQNERPLRVRAPGLYGSYSNYGTALAGAVVAAIEGVQWQDLIERDILRPLGLTHTSVREPYPARADLPAPMAETLAQDLSTGFRWTGAWFSPRQVEYITQIGPAGVMSASAADMARYMLLQLGDGTLDRVTVYGPAAAAAFRTPMTSLPRAVGAVAAGFFATPLPGGFRGYGHNGATLSFFANMTVVPELGLGIFVATNTEGGNQISDPLAARVVERFYAPPRPAPSPSNLDLTEATRVYAGQYRPTRRAYHGLEGVVGHLQAVPVTVSAERYLQIALGGQVQRFVPTDEPDVFRSADGGAGGVAFERDNGRAVRIRLAPLTFERVGAFDGPQTMLFAAMLTLLAAAGVVIGFFVRLGRPQPARGWQPLAGSVQLGAALAWLICAAAAAAFAASASDVTNIFYTWPTTPLLISSSAALAAALLTLLSAMLLPAVWRRTAGGWPAWRRVRYTVAVLIFAALSIVLWRWGALAPWDP